MDLEDFRKESHKEFFYLTVRELAVYFSRGQVGGGYDTSTESIEAKRIIIRNYLGTQSEEVRAEFERHLADPMLGELDDDIWA